METLLCEMKLAPSLEDQRETFRQTVAAAQNRMTAFAEAHQWGAYAIDPFVKSVRFFDSKVAFDDAVRFAFQLDESTVVPRTASAIVANGELLIVSPDLYLELYPLGEEEAFYEKLIAHEFAHELHIRVLNGEEEKMGPKWFFEGFALHAADQFTTEPNQLSEQEVWKIIEEDQDATYRLYKEVISYLLGHFSLEELVKLVQTEELIHRLKARASLEVVSTDVLDYSEVTTFFVEHWGTSQMVISSGIFQCDTLDGYAVVDQQKSIIGLLTYIIEGRECEIISLDSKVLNKGVGSRLLTAIERKAKKENCKEIKLITTNDNLHALAFYQKRGYQLVEVLSNAVEQARLVKPEIPLYADNGIPIRDELLLVKSL
jgi:GNAT superfamily N-acetyltransferase